MRSPTSRVGYIEVDGIDLGSAKNDRKSILTVTAVKAALASSEQTFNNLEVQLLLTNALGSNSKLKVRLSLLFPPLSTSLLPGPIGPGSLHGNHFDPCKKGIIEAALKGEIPIVVAEEQEP